MEVNLSVPQASVSPPESLLQPEVQPQSAALEVPAATVEADPQSKMPAVEISQGIEASRRAADLLPAAADVPAAITSDADTAATSNIPTVRNTSCTDTQASGQVSSDTCLGSTPTPPAPTQPFPTAKKQSTSKPEPAIAKAAAKQAMQQVKIPTKAKATAKLSPNQATRKSTTKGNINAQRVMTKPATARVQVGPINLSSAGISLNATAVKPYFNPQLRLPAIPMPEQVQMIFPLAIPAPITSLFGWRIHPITGTQRLHTGTDLGAPMGTPVMAAMAGRVILADDMGGYGISVAIEHDQGMRQTLYAHMSEVFVRPGDIVQQGTVIGRVGSTGASTGPHLHFELRQMLPDGTWVAQDASQNLQIAMSQLVQSLQLAQRPQPFLAQAAQSR
jgi:murein DD-endopeptidase MepM/ murein hydrolase activator NlpD